TDVDLLARSRFAAIVVAQLGELGVAQHAQNVRHPQRLRHTRMAAHTRTLATPSSAGSSGSDGSRTSDAKCSTWWRKWFAPSTSMERSSRITRDGAQSGTNGRSIRKRPRVPTKTND